MHRRRRRNRNADEVLISHIQDCRDTPLAVNIGSQEGEYLRLLGAIMLLITATLTAACEPAETVIHIPSGPITPTTAALAGRADAPKAGRPS